VTVAVAEGGTVAPEVWQRSVTCKKIPKNTNYRRK
jgi:hypothetical protein